MTTTQHLILDRIAAEVAKRDGIVLIDDQKYANTGTLRTYDAATLDHIAAINYEFQHGVCYFGPGAGERIAVYRYGQAVQPSHASWVKGSISELVAAVTEHLLPSRTDPMDPVERALQGLRDHTAELLGTPTNERNTQ